MPFLVFVTYDAPVVQPLLITPVAAASEVANRLTWEIWADAASAPLPDQLAKTVRERLVTESPSPAISVIMRS